MKRIIILMALFLALGAIVYWRWLSAQTSSQSELVNQVRIVVTSYPTEFLAKSIGGENVSVINLTPPGAEPHDFEPTPSDLVEIENSNLVLLIGAGFEPWSGNLNEIMVGRTVIASMVDDPLLDPHVWLDPVGYQDWAKQVYQLLSEVDPGRQDIYLANLGSLVSQLAQLDTEFSAGLSTCTRSDIITSHDAFGHLTGRYGLTQRPVAGLSPEAEPTPRTLANITRYARENGVTHIFFEELVSPRLAETIANEMGAQTLVLNPLEGLTEEQILAGQNYFSVQKDNLENLQIALNCR